MSKSDGYAEFETEEATAEQRAEHYRTQPRKAVPISQIKAEYPNPILAATGRNNGAVLTAGNICILAGEGGIAKSALTISLALSYACAGVLDPNNARMKPLWGNIFEGVGGRVLMVNYEDTPGTIKAKMEKLADFSGIPRQAMDNVFVQNLIGKPLYTTQSGITRAENDIISEMFVDDGWDQLWREIDDKKPSLVVLDPCLSAFTGNQNDPGEVRYFLMAVAERAQFSGHDMGVLMVAHSNKEARGKEADPFDPGKVSGTTQWTDSVRGVLTIDWHPDKKNRPGERILRIPKANLGRSRISCGLDTIRADSGEILGFETTDEWIGKEPQTGESTNGEPKNSIQAGFDKQAAIDQARADALEAKELNDIFEVAERSMCIKNDRPVPEEKDRLTREKWQEWVENAPEGQRRKWAKDAMDFAKWLYDAMTEADPKDNPEVQKYISEHPEAAGQIKEINAVITYILVALNELIFYIEGKISVDADGYFLSPNDEDEDSRPFFVLAMAAARRKPSVAAAIKISWEAWAVFYKEYRGRNPLGASVEARVIRGEITPYKPKKRAVLPRFEKVDVGEARRLIEVQAEPPPGTQLFFEIPEIESPGAAFWLLDIYDQAGGAANRMGRGAPWPMRLLIGGFLHIPIDRRDGNWYCFRQPTDEVIGWLRPNGWSQKKSRWEQFPNALEEVNRLGWLPIKGVGRVQMFGASVIPERPTDPFVEFIARVPPSAAHGARIDWPLLCKYGTESAPLYRAYLTACALMHRSANNSRPVTEVIGKALLGTDGEPIRKKGKIVRSTTEFEPNPAVRYVVGLTKAQLTEAIGLDATNRANQHTTMKAFERLKKDGVVDLQTEGRGKYQKYFLFGPNQWAEAQAEVVEVVAKTDGENRENR